MTLHDRLAILKAEQEAIERGRKLEREIWEAKLEAEREKSKNQSKWVDTNEAKEILGRNSYNTLMDWVDRGTINPPKKIAGRLHWERENLLNATPDGQE